MHHLRLSCEALWVDVRVAGFNGRWIASADGPGGPSLGLGWTPRQALIRSLEPFDGLIDELLASVPDVLLEHGAMG
ncbi:MAG TPA: hypothetical protein VH859_04545 [Candidatus Limnocylindria bacterium]